MNLFFILYGAGILFFLQAEGLEFKRHVARTVARERGILEAYNDGKTRRRVLRTKRALTTIEDLLNDDFTWANESDKRSRNKKGNL